MALGIHLNEIKRKKYIKDIIIKDRITGDIRTLFKEEKRIIIKRKE